MISCSSCSDLSIDKLIEQAEGAPVIKLVDLIIKQSIDESASDIHIEPQFDKFSLRYRIDGMLYEMPSPAMSVARCSERASAPQ